MHAEAIHPLEHWDMLQLKITVFSPHQFTCWIGGQPARIERRLIIDNVFPKLPTLPQRRRRHRPSRHFRVVGATENTDPELVRPAFPCGFRLGFIATLTQRRCGAGNPPISRELGGNLAKVFVTTLLNGGCP